MKFSNRFRKDDSYKRVSDASGDNPGDNVGPGVCNDIKGKARNWKAFFKHPKAFYLDHFPQKGNGKIVLKKTVMVEGRERQVFVELHFKKKYDYDRNTRQWTMFLAVDQLDHGVVNVCGCEKNSRCNRCKNDSAFISKVKMMVKPRLPERATVEKVIAEPPHVPERFLVTNGQNKGAQLAADPKNIMVTLQSTETTARTREAYGFGQVILPFKGEDIEWVWGIRTWDDGSLLDLKGKSYRPSKRKLPLDPEHVQIRPMSASSGASGEGARVSGEWHIAHAHKPHLRHLTFDIGVHVHLAVQRVNMAKVWIVEPAPSDLASDELLFQRFNVRF